MRKNDAELYLTVAGIVKWFVVHACRRRGLWFESQHRRLRRLSLGKDFIQLLSAFHTGVNDKIRHDVL